jgi:hypothetical protein
MKENTVDFRDLEDASEWAGSAPFSTVADTATDKVLKNAFGASQSKATIAKYEEKCTARGCVSGTFVSWAGRSIGSCYRCKGTGILKFKTSPEARAKAKAAGTKLKQAKADAKVVAAEAYRTANADFVAYLEEVAGWNGFAASLLQSITDYGSLTTNQFASAETMWKKHIAKQAEKAAEPQVETIDLTDVPAGRYAVPNGETRLKVAIRKPGANSKWHGSIFVDDGAEYGARQNYGRQMPGKQYEGKIVEQLKVIAADPLEAMKAYGHLVGACGVCGRKLEDEKSVALGIGPICLSKFG